MTEYSVDTFGSGVMSGTAPDLRFFQKLDFGERHMNLGKIAQVEIMIIQFLSHFKSIFKEIHSQVIILLTAGPTSMKFLSLKALHLLYIPHLWLLNIYQ